jgi:hypothetical protein
MSPRLDTEEKQKHWRCFIRRQLGKAMPVKPPAGYRTETEHWRCLSGGVNGERLRLMSRRYECRTENNWRVLSRRQEHT